MEGIELDCIMVHVLEAGLTFLEANNPKNRPSVKGFNIINGQLAESSDGATFESQSCIAERRSWSVSLSTKADVDAALTRSRCVPCMVCYTSTNPWTNHWKHGPIVDGAQGRSRSLASSRNWEDIERMWGEIQEAIDTCLFFQSEGRRLYGQTVNSELPDKELFTYRRPLGVVESSTLATSHPLYRSGR